jgi:Tfp pilus assembly protein PilO
MARPTSKGLSQLSIKHIAVDKANTKVIVMASVATAVLVFTIFACMALIDKIAYQNKVIDLRKEANAQLEANIENIEKLNASFIAFDSTPESAIGTSDKNSKIVLDALPSKYDFPALTTSMEYIVSGAGTALTALTGTDQETSAEQSSKSPKPIEIPLEVGVSGNYESIQKLIKDLERSIRPFKVKSIKLSGEDTNMTMNVTLVTYYQPSTELGIEEKVVKSDDTSTSKTTGSSGSTGTQSQTGGTQ